MTGYKRRTAAQLRKAVVARVNKMNKIELVRILGGAVTGSGTFEELTPQQEIDEKAQVYETARIRRLIALEQERRREIAKRDKDDPNWRDKIVPFSFGGKQHTTGGKVATTKRAGARAVKAVARSDVADLVSKYL